MSNLQTFIFDSQDVRVAGTAAKPSFCLVDVCRVLDINNASQVAGQLKQDGLSTEEVIDTLGRTQQATFISEPNLYRCITKSRKPEAEAFQDWIFEEVLPAIRKTGSYTDTNHKLIKMVRECSNKFGTILKSSPTEARSLVQVFASQSGLEIGPQSLLSQEQLSEQSLAMHRVALSFNKHINADKFAEKLSSPEAIAQLRSEMVNTAKENIELHRQLLELQVLMVDTVPRQKHDRLRADYELTIASMADQIEMLQTMAASANDRASQYQAMTTIKALPPSRTPSGRVSKQKAI